MDHLLQHGLLTTTIEKIANFTTKQEEEDDDETIQRQFHLESRIKIASLVNKSTIMKWFTKADEPNQFDVFVHSFDVDDLTTVFDTENIMTQEEKQKVWSNPHPHILHESNLCQAMLGFERAGSIKPHVLLTHLNENWGALSTAVPNRTVQWGDIKTVLQNSGGCTLTQIIEWYLNHPNVLAVFTTTHQAIDHPKVHSIPLGVKLDWFFLDLLHQDDPPAVVVKNKTQLLMINSRVSDERMLQFQTIIESFRRSSIKVSNTHAAGPGVGNGMSDYLDELQRSKFILCPSGLGWDTYRMWEAFLLGTIPIVERYNRTDGWHRTMDDLPILWVDNFEDGRLNASFLEQEYRRIARDASRYKYEKLTISYWTHFVKSFLPEGSISNNIQRNPSNSSSVSSPLFDKNKKQNHNKSTKTNKEQVEFTATENATQKRYDAFRYYLSQKALPICNVSKLHFNQSRMTGPLQPDTERYFTFDNPSKIGYGPMIPKTGSTTAKRELQKRLGEPVKKNVKSVVPEDFLFFAFLRHPMDRFLAGYHQMEVFWRMNWISPMIDQMGLTWWNQSCVLEPNFDAKDDLHPCGGGGVGKYNNNTAAAPANDITRLRRLHAFLDDIDAVGYFDQHILPMTYQIAATPRRKSSGSRSTNLHPQKQQLFLDISLMDTIMSNITQVFHAPHPGRAREMERKQFAWVIQWSDLQQWQKQQPNNKNSTTKKSLLAQRAIQRMCDLYREDVDCLPYPVPECSLPKEKAAVKEE